MCSKLATEAEGGSSMTPLAFLIPFRKNIYVNYHQEERKLLNNAIFFLQYGSINSNLIILFSLMTVSRGILPGVYFA